jgi:hypothetical protein
VWTHDPDGRAGDTLRRNRPHPDAEAQTALHTTRTPEAQAPHGDQFVGYRRPTDREYEAIEPLMVPVPAKFPPMGVAGTVNSGA